MAKNKTAEPMFTRSEIAQILNVSSLTIANREKNNKYPEPRRDMNSYRVYTLNDIFNLQLITYNLIDPKQHLKNTRETFMIRAIGIQSFLAK